MPHGERKSGKQDGGNLTAVIVLTVVLGPAIAEKTGLVVVGAEAQIDDFADPRPGQPLGHIARKVEMGLSGALVGDEKRLALRLLGSEALLEVLFDRARVDGIFTDNPDTGLLAHADFVGD